MKIPVIKVVRLNTFELIALANIPQEYSKEPLSVEYTKLCEDVGYFNTFFEKPSFIVTYPLISSELGLSDLDFDEVNIDPD